MKNFLAGVLERPALQDLLIPVLSGIFIAGLGWAFYARAVEAVTATEALILVTPEAILNPLLVALIIGEYPGPYALAGGAIVLTAVTCYTIRSVRIKALYAN